MASPTPQPISVFISYSRVDSATIDRLEAELIGYGFRTWVDREHLEGGDKWAAQIEHAIQASDVVVVGLSPDAITSSWVTKELLYAQQLEKPIIPVVLRSVERIPLLLVELQYIDMQANESQGLQQLRLRLLRLGEYTPGDMGQSTSAHAPAPPLQHIAPTVREQSNDPVTNLVALPAPAHAANLNALFMEGISAKAHDDLDQAEALLRQVIERDPQFGNGVASQQLAEIQTQLLPIQLTRLRQQAQQAEATGAWGEAISAWKAVLERAPNDSEASASLKRDEQNREAAWLYDNARTLVERKDWLAFQHMWQLLQKRAPGYGDPEGIYRRVPLNCPECGDSNPYGSLFCVNCGARLPNSPPDLSTVIRCAGCGFTNPGKSLFCDGCGERLSRLAPGGGILCSKGHANPMGALFCDDCGETLF